jgi:hypothetical protein
MLARAFVKRKTSSVKRGGGLRTGSKARLRSPATFYVLPFTLYDLPMPGLADQCGVCQEKFAFSLPRCPICHRAVCDSCSFRMGGSVFCSRTCGHAFFYGGDEEIQEGDASETDDDE